MSRQGGGNVETEHDEPVSAQLVGRVVFILEPTVAAAARSSRPRTANSSDEGQSPHRSEACTGTFGGIWLSAAMKQCVFDILLRFVPASPLRRRMTSVALALALELALALAICIGDSSSTSIDEFGWFTCNYFNS